MTLNSSPATHPREDFRAFADGLVEDGKRAARDLKNAEGPPQQRVFERRNADMRELSRLDERRDLRRAQDEAEIGIRVAFVGNDLDGLFKHRGKYLMTNDELGTERRSPTRLVGVQALACPRNKLKL